MNPNQTLQILDRMSRLDPVYQNRNLKAPSDPFLEGFAFGHQLRQNYLAEREARKNQQREKEYKDQFYKKHNSGTLNNSYNGQPQSQQGVYYSASPDGVYIRGNRLDSPNQNGIIAQGRQGGYFPTNTDNITKMGNLYNGSEAMQEVAQNQIANNGANKYTFNEYDYLPSKSNGYHINDNKRMAEWGSPQDWQMQQVRNAMRDVYDGTDWYKLPYNNFGYAIAKAEQPQKEVDRYPQELVGLTGEDLQRAGQAYNQKIDRSYSGFGDAIQNAENYVAPQVAPRVQPIPQYTPEEVFIPKVNMREEQGEYTPIENDYIPMEGTVKEIQANGLANRQKNFTNAQANRAGAQEIQRGYNPQGGHSKDPNLYFDFSSLNPFANVRWNEDYYEEP